MRLRFVINKTLWLGVLTVALCARARDKQWWQGEVFKLTESARTLQQDTKSVDSLKIDLLRYSTNPDKGALEVIDFLSDSDSNLAIRIKALASTMSMAGFSSQEDRPEVVYRIGLQCIELHLTTVSRLEAYRDGLKREAPQLSNQINAAIKVHDQAAECAARVCESIK